MNQFDGFGFTIQFIVTEINAFGQPVSREADIERSCSVIFFNQQILHFSSHHNW